MAGLDPRLQQDCLEVGRFPLCRLLLMRDANYPWFILVPDREAVTEIHHLGEADRRQLLHESCSLSVALESAFHPDKLNVAAIGNLVPQLHIHHVVRFRDDAAWPAPVWGRAPPKAYSTAELAAVVAKLKASLDAGVEYCV
jgi:diadenosine tetraphosphate (Ap4A) HIT family hydrolase